MLGQGLKGCDTPTPLLKLTTLEPIQVDATLVLLCVSNTAQKFKHLVNIYLQNNQLPAASYNILFVIGPS